MPDMINDTYVCLDELLIIIVNPPGSPQRARGLWQETAGT